MQGALITLLTLVYLLIGTVVIFTVIEDASDFDAAWALISLLWPLTLLCTGVMMLFALAAELGRLIRKRGKKDEDI